MFISQTLRAFFSFFYLLLQSAKQKQSGSDRDGRISYIKSRPVIGRITSYNVCYTKLLRALFDSPLIRVCCGMVLGICWLPSTSRNCGWSGRARTALFMANSEACKIFNLSMSVSETMPTPILAPFVITSYSIHYTKLYDFPV